MLLGATEHAGYALVLRRRATVADVQAAASAFNSTSDVPSKRVALAEAWTAELRGVAAAAGLESLEISTLLHEARRKVGAATRP